MKNLIYQVIDVRQIGGGCVVLVTKNPQGDEKEIAFTPRDMDELEARLAYTATVM